MFERVRVGETDCCRSMAPFLKDVLVAVLMTYFLGIDGLLPPPLLKLLLLISS